MPPRSRLALTGAAFLLSGAAALVYQVAWQRVLALQTGVAVHSMAIIVAAFMVGLGAGSEIGGRWSVRLAPGAAMRAFALVEAGIAVFGVMSPFLFYDVLYLRLGWLYAEPWRGAITHFLSLAVPTVLMGTSLPLLARATVEDGGSAPRRIGLLYGVNMLGAALGAFLTAWVLVPRLGIRGALVAAPLANLLAAVTAYLAGAPAERAQAVAPLASAEPVERPLPLAAWTLLYAASGFCALALEIVWFRLIDVLVKSTAYTFGTVLAVYLGGAALGTLLGVATVDRVRRPLAVFLACQAGALAWAALVPTALARLPAGTGPVAAALELLREPRSYEEGGRWALGEVLGLYVGVPAVLCVPATLLMGYSFTVLQRAVQRDARTAGRKVGLLQAANIAGCAAGSLVVGLAALDAAGTAGTLRLLALAGAAFALLGAGLDRRPRFAAVALALVLLALAVPSGHALWARAHGTPPEAVMVDEDATGVVAVARDPQGYRMFVNGRSHSTLPFGGLHTTLGAAPALVHPAPRRVAVIGLGSGDTAWAAGLRGAVTERIVVYEICAPERRLLERLASFGEPGLGKLAAFLRDPRVEVRLADGRHALQRGRGDWDVIEMDALPPSSPTSGNLYSLEFYALCARRLAAGGIMCTWAPTSRARATFRAAFPHVLEVAEGRVLLGSQAPLHVDSDRWRAVAADPAVGAYLGEGRLQRVLAHLASARVVPPAPPGRAASLNRDLEPLDEFGVPDPAALSAPAR